MTWQTTNDWADAQGKILGGKCSRASKALHWALQGCQETLPDQLLESLLREPPAQVLKPCGVKPLVGKGFLNPTSQGLTLGTTHNG